MTQISGTTILITGGASGIGRQLALQSARQGARVVVWDLNQEATDRTLVELRQRNPAATSATWPTVSRSTTWPSEFDAKSAVSVCS